MTLWTLLAVVSAAFSIMACVLLLAVQLTVYAQMPMTAMARGAGVLLLLGLGALQSWHLLWLLQGAPAQLPSLYLSTLHLVAPAFYSLFRGALQPKAQHWSGLLLYGPALAAALIPPAICLPLAFVFGSLYAGLLVHLALKLREQRKRFRLEAMAFAAHGAVAALILVIGLSTPWLGLGSYIASYATLIGLGLAAAIYTLIRLPDLPMQTAEAVRAAYAVSALKSVDVAAALRQLDHLMVQEQLYVNESLNLSMLANALNLGPHQLSELINTRFGVGFSRYVREHRVRAAQRMLIAEPRASVLSVGLAVGFTSQSNFYAAFREITGEVPGRYRSRHVQDG